MNFSINFIDDHVPAAYKGKSEKNVSYAVITINDFNERMIVSLDYWSKRDYKKQWIEGVDKLIRDTRTSSLLITDISNPNTTTFGPMVLTLYLVDKIVYVQNQWIELKGLTSEYNPLDLYEKITEHKTVTEDGEKISEWTTTLEALQMWRENLKSETQ